jgi:hypothetical protein
MAKKTETTHTTKRTAAGPSRAPVRKTKRGASELAPQIPAALAAPEVRPATKQALIIDLLRREGGVTLADLVAATGWLEHTTRAALTRLRQAGFAVERSKDEAGRSVYRIAPAGGATRSRKAA